MARRFSRPSVASLPASSAARRAVALSLGFAAIGSALLLGCSGGGEEADVPTVEVERGRIERLVVATGTIEPEKEVEVRSRVSGIVQAIHVAAGDQVEAGQRLIEIERELVEVRLEEARARAEEATAERRFADSAHRRAKRLHANGTMDDHRLDEARARHERAEAALSRAAASVRLLEVQHRYTFVEAPMAGRILDVDVEEGGAVASVVSVTGGTPLLWLAAEDALHLEGLVDESEIARVKVGQEARIRTEAFPDRVFRGRVREIAPLGERRENVTYFEVEVAVEDDGDHLLKPRMSADADVIAEVVEDAVVIPETALFFDGDDVYVERAEGDGFERTVVTTGISDGTRVQILSGLEPGVEVRVR